jgi:predicted DNA binding CopG/RHH family protein
MKKRIKLPKFKNENEERDFWDKMNLSEYFNASDFVSASFPNLKPSSKPISIRLPNYMVSRVKEKANALDIPYQALIKQYIAKGLSS